MTSNNTTILYSLECGHGAPGPATLVNGSLYCAWCQIRIMIAGVIEYEWHAKCLDCKFSRWAGLSKNNAIIFIDGHVRKDHPSHKGQVEYVKNPTAVRTAEKMAAWQAS